MLEFHGVWKAYPDWSGGPRTLRAIAARRAPVLRTRRDQDVRWALRDVSVRVPAGQSLGLIGHNGAGKSTFLRLASGLGRPSRGVIHSHADAASVLNLGTTFDPQLTGRENAYTAALVSGLARDEVRRLLPEALAFSELEGFEDAPVRTYSEGMKLRLAFSVIAVREPRLLVLDEVLAVGDLAFRTKCLERIAELRAGGTSLVLASHSLEEIRETCEQAVWLHHGGVRAYGDPATIIDEYQRSVHDRTVAATPVGSGRAEDALVLGENRFGSQEIVVRDVRIAGTLVADPPTLEQGDPLRVAVDLVSTDGAVEDPIVVVSVQRAGEEDVLLDLNTRTSGISLGGSVSTATVELEVARLDLAAGRYALNVGVFERDWDRAYDFHQGAYPFRVEGTSGNRGRMVVPVRWDADVT